MAVRSLLEHCLEKDPRRRQRDIGDVRLVLDDVLRAPAEAPRPAGGATAPPASLWHQSRALVGMAAVAIVVAAVLVVWVVTRVPPVAEAPAIISSVVLPAGLELAGGVEGRNAESRFAMSPDGRRLVIVAAEGSGGPRRLWMRSLASQEFQPLPETQNASYPFWSADSESVGFIAGDQIKKISVGGGTPVTVVKGGFRTGAWNGSGVILFAPGGSSPLYRVPASGGEPIRVTSLNVADGEVQHAYPSFLPDGEHFLYLGLGTKTGGALDPRGVYVASLVATAPAQLLLPGATLARYASGRVIFIDGGRLWAQPFDPDRRELRGVPVSLAEQVSLFTAGATGVTGAFSVSDGGVLAYQTGSPTTSQPTWFDRTGRRIAALGAPGDYGDVALSPDGTRLAVSLMAPESAARDLWILDGPAGSGQRFTFDPGDEFAPVWSPDATRILFSGLTNGSVRLFVKNADGVAGARSLGADALGLGRFATDWSGDGRLVMYVGGGRAINRSDLWTMPVEGEPVARPLVDSAFVETHGRFSPDGQSFAYTSNETGRFEVYVDRFPRRGGRRLVSRAGGGWPRWARSGRAIYFLSPTNQLMVADVSQELRVSEPRPLFDVRVRPFVRLDAYAYDVSPDGTRFLVNVLIADATSPAITVVANWTSLMP
jgi:hypothetical protein